MRKQQENGYFCTLMDKETIERILRENEFSVEEVGSNFFYSFARHTFRNFYHSTDNKPLLTSIFDFCTELDLQFRKKGDLDMFFAYQWLLKATKDGGNLSNDNKK